MSVLDRVREQYRHVYAADPSVSSVSPQDSDSVVIAAAPGTGALALCCRCHYFAARPARQPDGWCVRYAVETWANVEFVCEDFLP